MGKHLAVALDAAQGRKDLWDFMGRESLLWGTQQEQLRDPQARGPRGQRQHRRWNEPISAPKLKWR